jgi:prolyl oligopeptidase
LFYCFESYTDPPSILQYDIVTGKNAVHFRPTIDVDSTEYCTDQVFVTSKDGTMVPLFISYRKGLKLNGNNPTYLYGYGGFGTSVEPSFSSAHTLWMDLGGIYAEAVLRGGGEYGNDWHLDGTKLRKQNVFDDFIACAEWLIANKYTSQRKLAISGTSNGGLLVAACITQCPELFGAAIARNGVMDMLRYHTFTAGEGWTSEYGCVQDSEEQFKALLKYSPLHNVRDGTCYPPTLVDTAEEDDRVIPAHSYKFAAAMQAASAHCLCRIESKSGHGARIMPLDKQANQIADAYAFLVQALGISPGKLRRIKK